MSLTAKSSQLYRITFRFATKRSKFLEYHEVRKCVIRARAHTYSEKYHSVEKSNNCVYRGRISELTKLSREFSPSSLTLMWANCHELLLVDRIRITTIVTRLSSSINRRFTPIEIAIGSPCDYSQTQRKIRGIFGRESGARSSTITTTRPTMGIRRKCTPVILISDSILRTRVNVTWKPRWLAGMQIPNARKRTVNATCREQ